MLQAYLRQARQFPALVTRQRDPAAPSEGRHSAPLICVITLFHMEFENKFREPLLFLSDTVIGIIYTVHFRSVLVGNSPKTVYGKGLQYRLLV